MINWGWEWIIHITFGKPRLEDYHKFKCSLDCIMSTRLTWT